jgi:hypothetical protein
MRQGKTRITHRNVLAVLLIRIVSASKIGIKPK